MKTRRPAKARAAQLRGCLDLFGEVPITRQDVYAWLLAVANLDPSSERATSYVRTYGVLQKIVSAKLAGTFDELVASAEGSARFREIAAGKAVDLAANEIGLGDWGQAPTRALTSRNLRAPPRPKAVIAQERQQEQSLSQARKAVDASMLRRLPKAMPPLSQMLDDIGNPDPAALAGSLDVTPSTARRWMRENCAPLPVLLALFWLTKWGTSEVDARAHNDAVAAACRARSLQDEVDALRASLQKVGRIADFGSANDPIPNGASSVASPGSYPVPAGLPGQRDLPIVFTSLRIAPGVAARRAKKSA